MPKKLKLNLDDLKVQSFVTALDSEISKNFKGGQNAGTCTSPCTTCHNVIGLTGCVSNATECTTKSDNPCATNCSEAC